MKLKIGSLVRTLAQQLRLRHYPRHNDKMTHIMRLSVIVTILSCLLQAQGADKYTDENRPYEFGFNIEEQQHRHEKKDENGIIMGEFGFITADGVYHVTVYATDENGNFKILSMKNIRVKPYPGTSERKGNSIPFPPPAQANAVAQAPQQQQPASPVRSCSHCSIPTSTPAPELTNIALVSRNQDDYENQYPQYPPLDQPYQPELNYQPEQNYPSEPEQTYPIQPEYPQEAPAEYPEQPLQAGERNPKQFNSQYPEQPVTPTLISAQMQIVNKDTDIYQRGPGEREGLPNGLKEKDMKLLLYTFNYTVGFHGHHEEGYTDGAKVGYYYVTGRNGVRTRVDYVADENGFRPKITQEVLDLLSEDVPKPETEKEAKYGLKGYEFKWLYYPTDTKRR